MPLTLQQARRLVENPAFEAVFDEYEGRCFAQWMNATDQAEREAIHAKASVAREVRNELKNTAIDIHGNDRTAA